MKFDDKEVKNNHKFDKDSVKLREYLLSKIGKTAVIYTDEYPEPVTGRIASCNRFRLQLWVLNEDSLKIGMKLISIDSINKIDIVVVPIKLEGEDD